MKVSGPGNPLAKKCIEEYLKAVDLGAKTLADDLKNADSYNHDSLGAKYEDKKHLFQSCKYCWISLSCQRIDWLFKGLLLENVQYNS